MTLQDNIALHQNKVRNWTVRNLKADEAFMALSREDPEFCRWCLSQRPDMASQRKPKIKFLGLGHKPVDKPTEKVIIEPVEKISRTAQIYKDIIAYRDNKNFL